MRRTGGETRKGMATRQPEVVFEEMGVEEDVEWSREGRRKGTAAVMLEGYVEDDESLALGDGGGQSMGRTKSLTDEDLQELKGCLDLGFGFSYEEIPELCGTLPALELCYSMSQRFLDEQQQRLSSGDHGVGGDAPAVSPPRLANWKIASPGDHPDEIKARLKYWAQAVACTVRLCS
ncbi:hypothetical protein HPP92_005067 [Vanilla planifolia]|nr:hypothetical protein HPP92_005067 [Vanilla planifolia]